MSIDAIGLPPRGPALLLVGDCLRTLPTMPADHFHLCATSPPYFALRSYLPDGHPDKAAEIGSEPTPDAFVATMVAVFREVRRVLHPSGLLFVNLGDSYGGVSGKHRGVARRVDGGRPHAEPRTSEWTGNDGDLLNIPHRVAEALRADGWIWRQTIVWCLSGGTTLYAKTAKGAAPAMLKDLVRLDPATVELWNGSRWTRVVRWMRNERTRTDRSGLVEIEFRSGERVGCTAEHMWPTQRGNVTAASLVVGDVVPTCTLPEGAAEPVVVPDSELGWLCGFYLAEGNKTDKGLVFSVHASETHEFARIRCLAESFGGTVTFRCDGESGCITVYSRPLREMVSQYVQGRTSKDKRLSRKAWARPNGFLRAVLDGYLDGDGHWDAGRRFWAVGFTNNDGLASDLRTIGARLGCVVRLRRVQHGCNGKRHPGWRGRIRMEPSSHWNAKPNGEIVAIRNSRAREHWDVEVADEPHLFALASGILTHNCKPSPMPESISGWSWQRCRVKGGSRTRRAGIALPNNVPHRAEPFREPSETQWSPCPGCPKCVPNGGLVLRRGRGRCTTAHEYVFVFAKSPTYFWDSAAFVEKATATTGQRTTSHYNTKERYGANNGGNSGLDALARRMRDGSHTTRNPRSVWTISAEPSKEKHFASYPSELVLRCVQAGTSDGGCCPTCRSPFAPVVEKVRVERPRPNDRTGRHAEGNGVNACGNTVAGIRKVIRGYRATCECDAGPAVPCAVLDPFAGTGTTLQVASWMGREAIGCELSETYAEIARRKIETTPRCLAKRRKATTRKTPTAAKTLPGQLTLALD